MESIADKIEEHFKHATEHNDIDAICKGLSVGQKVYHDAAKKAGWWFNIHTNLPYDMSDPHVRATKLALVMSEAAEALEAVRRNAKDDKLTNRPGDEVELADVIIRALDYAGAYNLDLAGAIREKHSVNQTRDDHKFENRVKGGKQF